MRRTAFTPSCITAAALLALCSGCALASGSSPSGTSGSTSQTATAPSAASSSSTPAPLHEALQPFPAARADQIRWVIQLPPQAREADWRVELIPGQQMQVDCNRHRLIGQLQTQTVQGWGYDYYELQTQGRVMSTLMGCPEGSKRSAFVSAESLMLPYNSRLPMVIYTGKAYQVQYRLWQAQAARNDATAQ